MTDTTRTPRLLALMAGNGFYFAQVQAQFFRAEQYLSQSSVWICVGMSALAFLGVTGAYIALWRPQHDRFSQYGERFAITAVFGGMMSWIGFLMGFGYTLKP